MALPEEAARFPRHRLWLPLTTKLCGDVFAVVTISHSMPREIAPQVAGAWFIHVRNMLLNWISVIHHSFVVVSSLSAPIRDLPCLLGVVARNCGIGPHVTVTRNFAAIVKIVEHTELQCQLVLVGRDLLA